MELSVLEPVVPAAVAVDLGGNPPLGETFPDKASFLCSESLLNRLLPVKLLDFPEPLSRRFDDGATALAGRDKGDVEVPGVGVQSSIQDRIMGIY